MIVNGKKLAFPRDQEQCKEIVSKHSTSDWTERKIR